MITKKIHCSCNSDVINNGSVRNPILTCSKCGLIDLTDITVVYKCCSCKKFFVLKEGELDVFGTSFDFKCNCCVKK